MHNLKPYLRTSALALSVAFASSLASAHGDDVSEKPASATGDTPADKPAGETPARTDDAAATRDAAKSETLKGEPEEAERKKGGPFRGSILLFDQSATTQTVGIGKDYQSANPVYEWWFALKPRYTLYDGPRDKLSLNLWMNLYLELTNSDSTTTAHEPVIGPSYFWASYAHTLIEKDAWKTSVSLGPRIAIPTDKAARNRGQYGGVGASLGLSQQFPIAGKGAPAFSTGHLGISTTYNHPFNRATTAVYGDLGQLRQDIGGRTPVVQRGGVVGRSQPAGQGDSDTLGGGMSVENSLNLYFSGGVQITPKLGFEMSYIVLNSWAYAPKDVEICTATGCAEPDRIANPTRYRVSAWALASLDYDASEEMSFSLGYYNLSEQIGPDGLRRSPLWSPDSRFFVTMTGNLDAIYRHFAHAQPPPQTAAR